MQISLVLLHTNVFVLFHVYENSKLFLFLVVLHTIIKFFHKILQRRNFHSTRKESSVQPMCDSASQEHIIDDKLEKSAK